MTQSDNFNIPKQPLFDIFIYFLSELIFSDNTKIVQECTWTILNLFCHENFINQMHPKFVNILIAAFKYNDKTIDQNIFWALSNLSMHKTFAQTIIEKIDLPFLFQRATNTQLFFPYYLEILNNLLPSESPVFVKEKHLLF